jgi:TolA-binding protein
VEILYDYPAWQSAALLQAGKCSEALGQWKQAVETYQRLLKDFAESELAGDAAQRLKIAQERAKDQDR